MTYGHRRHTITSTNLGSAQEGTPAGKGPTVGGNGARLRGEPFRDEELKAAKKHRSLRRNTLPHAYSLAQ